MVKHWSNWFHLCGLTPGILFTTTSAIGIILCLSNQFVGFYQPESPISFQVKEEVIVYYLLYEIATYM